MIPVKFILCLFCAPHLSFYIITSSTNAFVTPNSHRRQSFVVVTTKFTTTLSSTSDNQFDPSALLSRLPSLDQLPNPFSNLDPNPPTLIPSAMTGGFEATPQSLINRAKLVLSTDFGIQDASLLDDDNFLWIGPTVDKPLGKVEYLAAGRYFDLRGAFPDLDYRAHDFRIDEQDPYTVRITARTVGTLRGELRLRNSILPPNGKRMKCPPESISMTFDPESGKLIKLCSGFCMDRQVGNTAGTCGVMAAATVAGSPPSDFEIYPATTVVRRFFGRPVAPLKEATSFLAPFPETVMVQLSKGIIAANMAANDPSLLAKSFSYLTRYNGPFGKSEYLKSYAMELFNEVNPDLSHFRVDPYDPYRVWVDVRPLAAGFEGPPQAMSFTFDDEGFCTRITSGAVMDPSLGNAGGLGGVEGYKYAIGKPSPAITTRPLPRVLGRVRQRILEPLTQIGVDSYILSANDKPAVEFVMEKKGGESKLEESDEHVSPLLRQPQIKLQAEMDALKTRSVEIADAAKANSETRRKEMEEAKNVQAELTRKRGRKLELQQREKLANLEKERKEAEAAKKARADDIAKQVEEKRFVAAAKKRAAEEANFKAEKAKNATAKPAVAAKGKPAASKGTASPFSLLNMGSTRMVQQSPPKKSSMQDESFFGLTFGAETSSSQQKVAPKKRAAPPKRTVKPTEPEGTISSFPFFDLGASAATQLKQDDGKRRAEEAKAAATRAADALRKQEAERQVMLVVEKRARETETRAAREAKAVEERAAEQQRRKLEAEKQQRLAAKAKARAEVAAENDRKQLEEKQRKLAEEVKARALAMEEMARRRREEEKRSKEAEAKAALERAAEERRKNEVERERRAVEAKLAAARAAEEKKRQLEERKAEAARAAEERRQRAAEQRARQEAAEARKAAADEKRREAEGKRAALELAKKTAAEEKMKAAAPRQIKAPRGVPTIISWKQRPDGGVTGKIYGSTNFADGERIETSPIVSGALQSGNMVTTGSGSRYFLSADSKMTIVNKLVAIKDMQAAKPGSTIALTKERRDREIKTAAEMLRSAKPRSTISLFGLGDIGLASAEKETQSLPKQAPRGVPTIARWRRNLDGSVTGFISGSPKFSKGERVTTSEIVSGMISGGEVVITGSGSRYFLS